MDGIVANIESVLQQVEEDENTEDLETLVDRVGDMRVQVTGEEPEEEENEEEQPIVMPSLSQLGAARGCKQAAAEVVRGDFAKEVLRAFAEAAMRALQPSHPEVFVGLATHLLDGGYEVALSEPIEGGIRDVVSLVFDERLLLRKIVPSQPTHEKCSYGSSNFLERYWEPVVSAVGHILIEAADAVALPASSGSGCRDMMAFRTSDGSKSRVTVSRSDDGSSWFISEAMGVRTAASKFTETDLKPDKTQVRCTNKDFPTYYGRTGTVRRVSPKRDYADVTVDFMRGLGEVVLTDKDIEIAPLPS